MDRFASVLLWAGLGCFAFSFVLSGLYPYIITTKGKPEKTFEEVTRRVSPDFKALKDGWPVAFERAFSGSKACLTQPEILKLPPNDPRRAQSEEAWRRAYTEAVHRGRDLYIAEGCWHCHSQYVRPVANEAVRFGKVRRPEDDHNALQRPVLWGTRRVGPDLTHEGGRHSDDWHAAHLWNPRHTSPGSVMPSFVWYFRKGWQVRRTISEDVAERTGLSEETSYAYPGIYDTRAEALKVKAELEAHPLPNLEEESERLLVAPGRGPTEDGLALIAYLQWLGTYEAAVEKKER